MATTPPLRLNRQQLAMFLKDQEQIRAFENLFGLVEPLAPATLSDLQISVGNAQAAADQAVGQVQDTQQAISVMLAAAESKATLALQQIEGLRALAELAALAPPPRERRRTRYGQFLDTTTQTAAAANTAYAITFNTAETWNRGVFLRSPSTSEVAVDTEGLYDFQFSVQIDKTSGGAARFWIWFRLNGADVANSASEIQIQGNDAEIFSSANLFLDLKAGDYVQMMWAVSDTSVQIQYIASAAFRPAVPSIILTVSNNIRGEL
jgi:hypothetical protein